MGEVYYQFTEDGIPAPFSAQAAVDQVKRLREHIRSVDEARDAASKGPKRDGHAKILTVQ